MQRKKLHILLMTGITITAVLVFYLKNNEGPFDAGNSDEILKSLEFETDVLKDTYEDEGFLDGFLQVSDDSERGTYKLISDKGDIYIKTERNYHNLLGTQVLVFINGTYEQFELLDIQSKVAGDKGYLISN